MKDFCRWRDGRPKNRVESLLFFRESLLSTIP